MSLDLDIPLDDICPSPTNPRTTFNEAGLLAMAETIKDVGVMQRILVRTNPAALDGDLTAPPYQLIAGERRWRSSRLAGKPDIPATLRDDLDDATIIKMQMIENLQREDLHPLEEAHGYRQMLDQHGYTAETLAAEIGKSRSYIFGQLKLLDLCEEGQRLFRGGTINASVALYLARIPTVDLQLKAIKDVTEKDYYGEKMSARAALRHIQNRYMTRLKAAPFPRDVEGVAGVGTCDACPKRTGNATDLYPDVDDPDVCTDPDCFALKRTAEAERQAANLGSEVQILTGHDAQKAMPSYHTETRTHARLDDVCTNDPQRRTYREIMGDDTEGVALVAHEEKFVPIVQKSAINKKLHQEGTITERQVQRAADAKEKQKLEIANAWRDRVFRETRDRAASEVSNYNTLKLLGIAMPVISHTFMVLAGYDKGGQVAGLWGALGQDNYTRWAAYQLALPAMKWEELLLVCLDLALIGERTTLNYHDHPELLLTVASALNLDAQGALADVQAEFAAAEAKKQAKTAKKSPGASTSESTSTPPTAALANTNTEGEDAPAAAAAGDREEPHEQSPAGAGEGVEKPKGKRKVFAIGNRVRIIGCGIGVEQHACLGKVGTIRDIGRTLLNGQPVARINLDDGGEFTALAEEIEMYEEPTGSEPPSADDATQEKQFQPGDQVVVIDSAAMNGQTGTVVRMEPPGTLYPCIVDIDDIEYHFFPSQLDLVETNEIPAAAEPITFRRGDRIEVKPDAKGPGGKRRKCAGKQGVIDVLIACSATPGGEIYAVQIDGAGETTNIRGDEMRLIDRPAAVKPKGPPIRYKHPENADLQWTGRGRKPKWVEAYIAQGGTLDELNVTEEIAA